MKPIEIINALRNSDQYIEAIFMQGSCYQFHLFLKTIFPDAKCYIHQNQDHVVSEISGELFDICGIIEESQKNLFYPLKDNQLEMVERWSFNRSNVLSILECPFCEEPICI